MPPSAARSLPTPEPSLRALERHVASRADDPAPLPEAPPEADLERIARLAARLLRAPMAFVSLPEPHRQLFPNTAASAAPAGRAADLLHALAQRVMTRGAALAVADAGAHPPATDLGVTTDLDVAGYLGVPVRSPDGDVLGALCVADGEPRAWVAADEQALTDLAGLLTEGWHLQATARRLATESQAHAAARSLAEAAFDAIPDVFFVLNAEGRLLQCNRRLQAVTGHSDEELAVMRPEDFVCPADRPRVREAIEAILREGAATIEVRIQTKSGEQIPYEFNGRPLRAGATCLVGICGTGRDVSSRQASRRALREREVRFRSFVEATAQVVFTADARGAVTELSSAWSAFTGQAPEEVSGWGWADALHPSDRPRIEEAWRTHIAARTLYTDTFRVRRRDGAYHWFCTRVVPVFADDGAFVEWVGACTDVQERRQASHQLQESEERLRIALDAAQMGMWDLDLRTLTVAWSPQTMALFGVPADAFDGQLATSHALVYEPDQDLVRTQTMAAVEAAAASGQPQALVLEYRVPRDGGLRWFRSLGRVFLDAAGTPVRIAGTVQDVTDEKARQDALVAAKEQAEEVARMKSAFLNNMSHEIRTPLTTVLGFADLLAFTASGQQVEIVDMIQEGGRRLLTTLNSVLDLARLEGRKLALELQPRDVAQEVAGAVRMFNREAQAKGLALTFERPAEPVWVAADEGALQRVLTNLLSNAIKFTEHGHVAVRLERGGPATDGGTGEVCVVVEDSGMGMDEAFVQKAFEPFYQESEGLARNHEGCGLGLTLVHRLMTLMGGRVEVESVKGQGSTFRVWLPAAPPGPLDA